MKIDDEEVVVLEQRKRFCVMWKIWVLKNQHYVDRVLYNIE